MLRNSIFSCIFMHIFFNNGLMVFLNIIFLKFSQMLEFYQRISNSASRSSGPVIFLSVVICCEIRDIHIYVYYCLMPGLTGLCFLLTGLCVELCQVFNSFDLR